MLKRLFLRARAGALLLITFRLLPPSHAIYFTLFIFSFLSVDFSRLYAAAMLLLHTYILCMYTILRHVTNGTNVKMAQAVVDIYRYMRIRLKTAEAITTPSFTALLLRHADFLYTFFAAACRRTDYQRC